jgi:hypothetical protein
MNKDVLLLQATRLSESQPGYLNQKGCALLLLDLFEEPVEIGQAGNIALYAGYACANLLYRLVDLLLATASDMNVRAFGNKEPGWGVR